MKTLAFIVIAPVLGWLLGTAIMILLLWIFRRKTPAGVDHLFRRGQLISAGLYSLMHGTNDAQKTMGISPGCSSLSRSTGISSPTPRAGC